MRKLVMILAVLFLTVSPVGPAEARTPEIDHVVVVVLQNATFDHMFGTYPGVDGLDHRRDRIRDSRGSTHVPAPLSPEDLGRRGSFPLRLGEEALSNGAEAALDAFNGGRMDGFFEAQEKRGKHAALALQHYDRSTMPALWNLADEYVLFDRFFSAAMNDSLANTLSLTAGDHHGITRGTKASLAELWESEFPTIFDHAEAAGVSWRYYVGNLDQVDEAKMLRGDYFKPGSSSTPLYWAPVLSIERFWKPGKRGTVRDQAAFFEDAARGEVPSISYILPSPNTHWPTMPLPSQTRLLSIINALKKSPGWNRTAVFVVWDDWGGFYDHVRPPRSGGRRLGFRVPALLISPLAKRGYISSSRHDHTSIPAFIAETFGMESLKEGRTPGSFDDVWADRPRSDNPILTLGEPTIYEATGREQAQSVFGLYLLGFGWTVLALGVFGLLARRQVSDRHRSLGTSSAAVKGRPQSDGI
jgi:phospholipase C